ncbi:MAG: hypothetical protein COZ95_00160, partial [Nitrospirae bacterium CG_4_8_14_3_um_filter_50_41]
GALSLSDLIGQSRESSWIPRSSRGMTPGAGDDGALSLPGLTSVYRGLDRAIQFLCLESTGDKE